MIYLKLAKEILRIVASRPRLFGMVSPLTVIAFTTYKFYNLAEKSKMDFTVVISAILTSLIIYFIFSKRG